MSFVLKKLIEGLKPRFSEDAIGMLEQSIAVKRSSDEVLFHALPNAASAFLHDDHSFVLESFLMIFRGLPRFLKVGTGYAPFCRASKFAMAASICFRRLCNSAMTLYRFIITEKGG